MSAAREKIDGVLLHLRQRQEKQRQALGAWKRSQKHVQGIAQALLEGTTASVHGNDEGVYLAASNGAKASFYFDRQQLGLVGRRYRAMSDADAEGELFFSLKIEPPARPQGYAQGQWGPSRAEGIGDLTGRMDSQAAFEKAIADWFEWAHMGDGAPPAGA